MYEAYHPTIGFCEHSHESISAAGECVVKRRRRAWYQCPQCLGLKQASKNSAPICKGCSIEDAPVEMNRVPINQTLHVLRVGDGEDNWRPMTAEEWDTLSRQGGYRKQTCGMMTNVQKTPN